MNDNIFITYKNKFLEKGDLKDEPDSFCAGYA